MADGSTARLLRLCGGYFGSYVVTGICVKLFVGRSAIVAPPMGDIAYLMYSTAGGAFLCSVVAVAAGWLRLPMGASSFWFGRRVPTALAFIIPSGLCTAVVIPTTTLLYSFPISVMVAMVIMRGSVIVISRAVDAIQLRQGLLKKRVHPAENIAVGFALLAVSVPLVWHETDFSLLDSPIAVSVLVSYVAAYAVRIYLMNYFKNTSSDSSPRDNRAFFAWEQMAAAVTMLAVVAIVITVADAGAADLPAQVRGSLLDPHDDWMLATTSGLAYGLVAFFSVFLFMFEGRSATFAGLVNRLTSLVAGTTSTLVLASFFGGRLPSNAEWLSLTFILAAVGCLGLAEQSRARVPTTAPQPG